MCEEIESVVDLREPVWPARMPGLGAPDRRRPLRRAVASPQIAAARLEVEGAADSRELARTASAEALDLRRPRSGAVASPQRVPAEVEGAADVREPLCLGLFDHRRPRLGAVASPQRAAVG